MISDDVSENTNKIIHKDDINVSTEISDYIEKKVILFREVLKRTSLHVQKSKIIGFLGINDYNCCMRMICALNTKINDRTSFILPTLTMIQDWNNELSCILKLYGTRQLVDLLVICLDELHHETCNKWKLILEYFHPISYRVVEGRANNAVKSHHKKKQQNPFIVQNVIEHMTCEDIMLECKEFYLKIHGMILYVVDESNKKTIAIKGCVDDIVPDLLTSPYIREKLHILQEKETINKGFSEFCLALSLKEYLINTNNLYEKYLGYMNHYKTLKQKSVGQIAKDWLQEDLFSKRLTIMILLIKSHHKENDYLAYLLYDLLSDNGTQTIDTNEQIILIDSLPLSLRVNFREAMRKTVQYTCELSNFDINKVSLEQQICLMNVPDIVKEKAMSKLKEVKSKSDDSGSKARQYLDGLLKIPFGIYRKEPILNIMDYIKNIHQRANQLQVPSNSLEIVNFIRANSAGSAGPTGPTGPTGPSMIGPSISINDVTSRLIYSNKKELLEDIAELDKIYIEYQSLLPTIQPSALLPLVKCKNPFLKQRICDYITAFYTCADAFTKACYYVGIDPDAVQMNVESESIGPNGSNVQLATSLKKEFTKIQNYISSVRESLDGAVHGHENAKKQIERIVGQWINGEQSGYCFGFEGPPGVGKTSLAKRGLSDCLKDGQGNGRPFAMIQMGGDSNGSSLHGHNYTYVGSTWGSIVQILMDNKCMNPIIYIDELDKISNTEHGREIVGILTHLLDPTQNDCFQDKYFSGIDLDLSKALFILSYNDVDRIDKILLDRIHRIKFNNLSIKEKLVIANKHILPDVYKKMGLVGVVNISDEVLKYIIEEYTIESGVRKLREILFEIVGEINLNVLRMTVEYSVPIHVSIEDITTKYFKNKRQVKHKKVSPEARVGIIHGLYANSLGQGGILPIHTAYFPSDKTHDLKLTGMLGDVLKESFSVAQTLAWRLATESGLELNIKKGQGIHIHCPEGAIEKNGPSAGGANTTVLYSLFTGQKIPGTLAMTGEVDLNGNITEIGGLQEKVLGSVKEGITTIIYPEENKQDYLKIMEKYATELEHVTFHPVSTIEQVLSIVFPPIKV